MGGRPPKPLGFNALSPGLLVQRGANCARPRRIPASESALGSRPRGALPSAQMQPVQPESRKTSTTENRLHKTLDTARALRIGLLLPEPLKRRLQVRLLCQLQNTFLIIVTERRFDAVHLCINEVIDPVAVVVSGLCLGTGDCQVSKLPCVRLYIDPRRGIKHFADTGEILRAPNLHVAGVLGVVTRFGADPIGFAPPEHIRCVRRGYSRLEKEDRTVDGRAALIHWDQSRGTVAGNALAGKFHIEGCSDGCYPRFDHGADFGAGIVDQRTKDQNSDAVTAVLLAEPCFASGRIAMDRTALQNLPRLRDFNLLFCEVDVRYVPFQDRAVVFIVLANLFVYLTPVSDVAVFALMPIFFVVGRDVDCAAAQHNHVDVLRVSLSQSFLIALQPLQIVERDRMSGALYFEYD